MKAGQRLDCVSKSLPQNEFLDYGQSVFANTLLNTVHKEIIYELKYVSDVITLQSIEERLYAVGDHRAVINLSEKRKRGFGSFEFVK